jgi:hypothetical protein
MIPEIGVMIGLYIITKMLSMLSGKTEAKIVNWLCLITIVATVIIIIDLISRSTTIPSKY